MPLLSFLCRGCLSSRRNTRGMLHVSIDEIVSSHIEIFASVQPRKFAAGGGHRAQRWGRGTGQMRATFSNHISKSAYIILFSRRHCCRQAQQVTGHTHLSHVTGSSELGAPCSEHGRSKGHMPEARSTTRTKHHIFVTGWLSEHTAMRENADNQSVICLTKSHQTLLAYTTVCVLSV